MTQRSTCDTFQGTGKKRPSHFISLVALTATAAAAANLSGYRSADDVSFLENQCENLDPTLSWCIFSLLLKACHCTQLYIQR